ncbi:hypothetical protein M9H77_36239 [Catharanthus roseus]|uniref:Uncharacterized protein n=1 Tax=Catharanthus roseus TaxID=4058 RepID=A0ACB9ZT19_CATRO|nr:hypothetical protein M9H77_36239 [Catharanthus roseus]
METANAQLSEMNTSLIEINKRLIDECIVDGGRIESLNEAPAQAQLEIAKHIEEDENVNDQEAPSRGGSQEEPTEESREDQNQNILDPIATGTDKGGMSEADKSVTNIQKGVSEKPANDVDKDHEDSNTERFRKNILDTQSMNVWESADLMGRLTMELLGNEHAPSHNVFGERPMIEHI